MTSRSDLRERIAAAIAAAAGVEGYDLFLGEIADVVIQATSPGNKGEVRHGRGRAWSEQPIVRIPALLGPSLGQGYLLGQALKKVEESTGLGGAEARVELHGAAVYVLVAAALRASTGA